MFLFYSIVNSVLYDLLSFKKRKASLSAKQGFGLNFYNLDPDFMILYNFLLKTDSSKYVSQSNLQSFSSSLRRNLNVSHAYTSLLRFLIKYFNGIKYL